jgi:hypothetical protein
MSHLPRVPIRFIQENDEILDGFTKSLDSGQRMGGTDQLTDVDVVQIRMGESYRTAPGRTDGNTFFRREPNGSLCYAHAVDKIVDAIHRVKDKIVLNGVEAVALSVLFPEALGHLYEGSTLAATAAIQLRLSPGEILQLTQLVAAHLDHEMAYMLSSHAR